jgi:hypothetical protein
MLHRPEPEPAWSQSPRTGPNLPPSLVHPPRHRPVQGNPSLAHEDRRANRLRKLPPRRACCTDKAFRLPPRTPCTQLPDSPAFSIGRRGRTAAHHARDDPEIIYRTALGQRHPGQGPTQPGDIDPPLVKAAVRAPCPRRSSGASASRTLPDIPTHDHGLRAGSSASVTEHRIRRCRLHVR